MTPTVGQLMWGYQAHFRVMQGMRATTLFRSLDVEFEPSVFLVGVLTTPTPDRATACVEPGEEFWITSADFDDVLARAAALRGGHPESRLFHSRPSADAHRARLDRFALRSAIQSIIDEHARLPAGRQFHVSTPVPLGPYSVCLVLGLQQSIFERHPALERHSIDVSEFRHAEVSRSLLESVIDGFLERSAALLAMPEPGMEPLEGDDGALLQRAGDRLMRDIAVRVDGTKYQGVHGLFAMGNAIAALSYERREANGGLLLARRDHPAVVRRMTFDQPMRLSDARTIRKLLELTTDALMLHTDTEGVFGLVELDRTRSTEEDCFEVRVLGRDQWELRSAGRPLLRVRSGVPSLPQPRFDERRLRRDLPRLFPEIDDAAIGRLLECVGVAAQAPRGAVLVIQRDAAAEAERLGIDGTRIEPQQLDPDLLRRLIMIDGAVLLDPECRCYGVGMILDGVASRRGDPSRGARYNSAIRYIDGRKGHALAIVVSEDGTIDSIPELKPTIDRAEIEGVLQELDELTRRLPDRRWRWHDLADWCEAHRFYFRAEDCDRINACMDREREVAERSGTMVFVRSPFSPDPEFDEALYYARG